MLKRWWSTLFLEERPSVSLSLFRVAIALTIGLHIIPTFLYMEDNYLSAAFRQQNHSFFTPGVLAWAGGNSDGFVWAIAVVFLTSWLCYLLGLFTCVTAWLTAAGCYYFYARNSLHIGTLSYDILLVTLFVAIVTPYPGDSFSLDSAIRGDAEPFRNPRPFFIQRLLQIQLASFFFYTGLGKWTAGGNWLSDNPYYYLLNSPPEGVVKNFLLRGFLAARPGLCYVLGAACIVFEMSLPIWLFWRKTRPYAIAAGIAFHFMLLFTLHVPTIFFFLFPPLFLLFIDPEAVVGWIDSRRARWQEQGRDKIVYDGDCGFCQASLKRLVSLDYTGRLEPVNFRAVDAAKLDARLTPEACHARLHLLEWEGRLSGGFQAFKRLSLRLPLLWPLAPLLHIPGLALVGEPCYDWIARNRFRLWHSSAACDKNACVRFHGPRS